ncbi:MAG: endolytic transglycosylase MltG [Tissierellia bacterium]|nr:endolytic transglycosylase MltG [Tissierellia bacterium]
MEDLLERIKDILYDGIDYIIMIAIIVVVILVINWRLGGLFAPNDIKIASDTPKTISEDGYEDDSSEPSEEGDEELPDDISPTPQNESPSSTLIELYIPAGSTSSSIGDALIIKGLIEDKAIFLEEIKKSNLETKLRHGMYRIPLNSSIGEILDILTS